MIPSGLILGIMVLAMLVGLLIDAYETGKNHNKEKEL